MDSMNKALIVGFVTILMLVSLGLISCTELQPVSATISAKNCNMDFRVGCISSQTVSFTVDFEKKDNLTNDAEYIVRDKNKNLIKNVDINLASDKIKETFTFRLPDNVEGEQKYKTFLKVGDKEYRQGDLILDVRKPDVSKIDLNCNECGNIFIKSDKAEYSFSASNKDKELTEFKVLIELPIDVKLSEEAPDLKRINLTNEFYFRYEKLLTRKYNEDISFNFELVSNMANKACSNIKISLYVKVPDLEKNENWHLVDQIDSSEKGAFRYCHTSAKFPN